MQTQDAPAVERRPQMRRRFDGHPPAPRTVAETGLSLSLLVELTLKTLHLAGDLTGSELSARLGLPFSVIQGPLDELKSRRHCEIVGGTMSGEASYSYRITVAGHERAALAMRVNQYVGAAPVPLEQYRDYMLRFRERTEETVTREKLREAFKHLVVSDGMLDKLGPAINSGHSMFIYGPPGNGKSVISQGISRLLGGNIAIPHALEVDGSIVRWFDSVKHDPLPGGDNGEIKQDRRLDNGVQHDERWVACRRPNVMVGGEVTLESLELSYDPAVGFHQAPLQAVANGGLLIIDDFGRQRCSPRDLLNRWIVPLESRIDFLTLSTGHTFDIPFQVLVVFATNIEPSELVDEAFLRRIQYKINAESPTVQEFTKIFEIVCGVRDIPFEAPLVDRLLTEYYGPRNIELRGCQPRDLIDHALSLGAYLGEPRRLTMELLIQSCSGYFVDQQAEVPTASHTP